MITESITTKRLELKRLFMEFAPELVKIRNDPEVGRFQSWVEIGIDEAEEFCRKQKELVPGTPGEWISYAVTLKDDGSMIGDCGLKIMDQDERQAEIGCTLGRAFQGKGYATEALKFVIEYGFNALNLHRIVGIADCRNTASIKLMEKLGMRMEGHFIKNIWFKGEWGDEYLYAVLKDEWN